MYCSHICVFFFKQKTSYELRISDWSSDVCSSDLELHAGGFDVAEATIDRHCAGCPHEHREGRVSELRIGEITVVDPIIVADGALPQSIAAIDDAIILGSSAVPVTELQAGGVYQIGRASGRERVCQYV